MTLRWRKADESIKLVHCPDHFEAGRRHLKEQFPDDQLIGVFWAKAEEIQGP